jgi:hypothetical protein
MSEALPLPELPPLPQACDITPVSWSNLFSVDQMRQYGFECARLAVEAERERCAKIADDMDYGLGDLAAAIRKG